VADVARQSDLGDAFSPRYFEFQPGLHEPEFICIYNLSEWVGCPTIWHSWAWQWVRCKNASKSLAPAVRLLQDGPVQPVFEIACAEAFWVLDKGTVEVMASSIKDLKYDASLQLCPMLEQIIQNTLQCHGESM